MTTDRVIWSILAMIFVTATLPILISMLSALVWPIIGITGCLIAARLVWWMTSRY